MTNEEKLRRFEKALAYANNTHTVADVMDRVRENRAACWPNGDSVIVTEVIVFPRLRAVNYWIVSGTLRECAELQPDIDAWAIEQGCSLAIASGRMGWLGAHRKPFGEKWRLRGVCFDKILQPLK